jgi:hypothetical protein
MTGTVDYSQLSTITPVVQSMFPIWETARTASGCAGFSLRILPDEYVQYAA